MRWTDLLRLVGWGLILGILGALVSIAVAGDLEGFRRVWLVLWLLAAAVIGQVVLDAAKTIDEDRDRREQRARRRALRRLRALLR